MFQILDGRTAFWQWDLGQRLVVGDEVCNQVHFCNKTEDCSFVCEVYEENGQRLVDVPNILLRTALTITVFAYVHRANEGMTKHSDQFLVLPRTKPADYIYTETEVLTVEKAVEDALQAAKESGDFKGDKGDKGDAGVVNFVVVTELPETGSGDSIYLVPNPTGENNNFDEYIWQNGAWEKIGSAGVEVNLDEYVKKTDYATQDKAGLVKGSVAYGTYIGTGGIIDIQNAKNEEIDAKSQTHKPITPSNLDYAVKKGLADNKETWTDEEKAAAREQLGIESNIFVANPDTTWQEIDDAYSAGKYIFYAFDSWGIMNLIPLCQRGSNDVYIFTHIRENKYLYTVKVKKDNTRDIGSVYVVDKIDFDALVARVEALEGK
jgi:hypothetical protein